MSCFSGTFHMESPTKNTYTVAWCYKPRIHSKKKERKEKKSCFLGLFTWNHPTTSGMPKTEAINKVRKNYFNEKPG